MRRYPAFCHCSVFFSHLIPAEPIVLALKPHQETITNIDDFIWRMCVSYRKLNSVTLPFEYPIARCNDSSDNFGDSHGQLLFISLDAAPASTKSLSTRRQREARIFRP